MLEVDLSSYPERFDNTSRKLILDKAVNFVYGRNGTGKTTVTNTIKDSFQAKYNIYVFKDFEGVAVNERLDAIALGNNNAIIQTKINSIDLEIISIRSEIEESERANLLTRYNNARQLASKQKEKLNKFYTQSARELKGYSDPQIVEPNYDKNKFQKDIPNANELSLDEKSKLRKMASSERRDQLPNKKFPSFDFKKQLEEINKILQHKITPKEGLADLDNDPVRQDFAKNGLAIHSHKAGEVCAFCGNLISEDRWRKLEIYFDDSLKQLDYKIQQHYNSLNNAIKQIECIELLDRSRFYAEYVSKADEVNALIQNTTKIAKNFLLLLQDALDKKRQKPFTAVDQISVDLPENFSKCHEICNELIDKNNEISENFAKTQLAAKNKLKNHYAKKFLLDFNYDAENTKLVQLEEAVKIAKDALEEKRLELIRMNDERNKLVEQTKNEEKAAKYINELLKSTGNQSFTLELVNDDSQRGQYRVRGHDGKMRPVSDLSKGERNIVALLYFLSSLEAPQTDTRSKIIILDDPMTSNDDAMQYLMISEIQRLYTKIHENSRDFFILLTHNCHFYLNIFQNPSKKPYKKYGIYHFLSNGKVTSIKAIKNQTDDFETNYDMLWSELRYLYEQDKPNMMLNACRKICETYLKFNCIDSAEFYKDSNMAKKLFDVNSHSIDDLEASQNELTRDEIKVSLGLIFDKANAKAHFDAHWPQKEASAEGD